MDHLSDKVRLVGAVGDDDEFRVWGSAYGLLTNRVLFSFLFFLVLKTSFLVSTRSHKLFSSVDYLVLRNLACLSSRV